MFNSADLYNDNIVFFRAALSSLLHKWWTLLHWHCHQINTEMTWPKRQRSSLKCFTTEIKVIYYCWNFTTLPSSCLFLWSYFETICTIWINVTWLSGEWTSPTFSWLDNPQIPAATSKAKMRSRNIKNWREQEKSQRWSERGHQE